LTALSAPAVRRARRRQRRSGRRLVGWAFVAPFVAVFGFALIGPIGYAIYLSLYQNKLLGGNSFAWFANYSQALSDPNFWSALTRVAEFLAVQVPIMLGLALCVALAIDSARLYGARIFRLVVFLPYAVPAVVAALMWGFMYGNQFGLVSDISNFTGISLPNPLGQHLVLASIGNIVTWEYLGYNMLIFYSALQAIPAELYEAAALDGAGSFRVVTAIKLPALKPAILVATIFSIIGSFQLFNEPTILKQLTPDTISSYFTPNMYAYNLSFSGQQYNYSAAIAILMGVITMGIAYIVQRSVARRLAQP
jgi:multiple sugar transport system permease protein